MFDFITDFFYPKPFVLTTKGQVCRIEKRNRKLGTVEVSFGSFDLEKWIISSKVVLSDSSLKKDLKLEEVISMLSKKAKRR